MRPRLTILVALAFTFAACSGAGASPSAPAASVPAASVPAASVPAASPAGKLKLGITIYPPVVSVVASAVNAAEAEAKALGVEAVFAFAEDAAKQQSAVESLISQGVNILAIDPNDSTAIGTSVKLANTANIPVIMWIGKTESGTVVTSILSPDEKSSAALSTFIFQDFMGGSGEVAFIQGNQVHAAFIAREKGMLDTLPKFPNVKLVASGIGNETADKANPVALDMITKNPNLKAIYADSDAMADGAYSAVESSGKTAQIGVFGYNGSCPTLNSIWNGKIKATLYQGWSGFGANVVQVAVKVFNGESVPELIENPAYVIDKKAMEAVQAGTFEPKDPTLTVSVTEAIANKCP